MSVRAVVVDASILVDFLLGEGRTAAFEELLHSKDHEAWVPTACDVEVVAALRRRALRGSMLMKRAAALIDSYLDLPLERHGHESLLPRMFELAANFTAYDAVYVALAERLMARLMTADARLARAVVAHTDVPIID